MKKAKKLVVKKKIKAKPVVHTSRLMKDVDAFHKKFKRKAPKTPQFPDVAEFEFRLKFLQEEIDEMVKAYAEKNLEDYADALVDITYVALGAAHLSGVPFDKCWAQVHKANMGKKRASKASDSTRGYVGDIVKPKNWKAPNLVKVLESHGALISPGAVAVIKEAQVKIEHLSATDSGQLSRQG